MVQQSDKNSADKTQLVKQEDALTGRTTPMPVATTHAVTGHSMTHVPDEMNVALFAMGCFWGVERLFWQQKGVYSTAAGYSGGFTPNPTYREVCTGQTGHAEVVRVVFDPAVISYEKLLQIFWENHDPAQGMRQGGDIGTQYRSAIYVLSEAQQDAALASLQRFQDAMDAANDQRHITTEISEALPFYYAEDDHQQYLFKNPEGYCGLGGIGVCLPPTR
ncbi:MAG: peptide-methionine (S)-S-oxide reductase MsrA [Ewingella americana]|uniref:peptide-methionine (S)-S-oxide reductase MsrA n=1 Tax=Ewingella americana TaxID=41202 RepID=UPI00242A4CBA|nr:peptide-methionine (S)-S-oxide reductase MsrA [Ewingella americana]MCI1677852.1 peptide-methionine (S)-S-oxide reductase MsrA [Ewingella americana]MCI1855740.1 peptide-methionine (S)-S-oxide reductase MsrA [Ewingella americana]MCI1863226.1 peptide-methionine (S)-S-oxide reductase MsrA [Ewingella americana]MCI2141300.1 peptide-methionine (S)-S-oxide reductase MsrA [Ewingella americana]MCI2164716.1 peptide-methionine (S)-S-oxide reductase MsrA [Ewingella americana]